MNLINDAINLLRNMHWISSLECQDILTNEAEVNKKSGIIKKGNRKQFIIGCDSYVGWGTEVLIKW